MIKLTYHNVLTYFYTAELNLLKFCEEFCVRRDVALWFLFYVIFLFGFGIKENTGLIE